MPTTCKIYFENNPHKIVFSGQKLQMTVRIKLTKDIKIRGVNIHLRGTTHVRFSDRYGNYAADEDVLDITKCLLNRNGNCDLLFYARAQMTLAGVSNAQWSMKHMHGVRMQSLFVWSIRGIRESHLPLGFIFNNKPMKNTFNSWEPSTADGYTWFRLRMYIARWFAIVI